MLIRFADFNSADELASFQYSDEWAELEQAMKKMPLHLKACDQRQRVGKPIFDPVGTNAFLSAALSPLRWVKQAIPGQYRSLGQDVDFFKNGVALEAQFSNYPFLLNNIVRTQVLYNNKVGLAGTSVGLLVIVTKAHMFPSSNSTLYYEQAVGQLTLIMSLFSIPVRLVGLHEDPSDVDAHWTTYGSPRYSRTVISESSVKCRITASIKAKSSCRLELLSG